MKYDDDKDIIFIIFEFQPRLSFFNQNNYLPSTRKSDGPNFHSVFRDPKDRWLATAEETTAPKHKTLDETQGRLFHRALSANREIQRETGGSLPRVSNKSENAIIF